MKSPRKHRLNVRIANFNYIKPEATFVQKVSTPQGISGIHLLRFAKSISHDDLIKMKEAIEQGCEWADDDEW